MRTIRQIKVWKNRENTETRIYIDFFDEKRSGEYYLTGNKYNKKGSLINMSLEEKEEALNICTRLHGLNEKGGRFWRTYYENEIYPELKKTYSKGTSMDEEYLDRRDYINRYNSDDYHRGINKGSFGDY